MKKSLFAVLVLLAVSFFVTSCSEDSTTITGNNNPVTQEALQPDFMYVAMASAGFSNGAEFHVFAKNPYQIKTDLGINATVISYEFPDPANHDFVNFKVTLEQGGDTTLFSTRRTPFKFSEIPPQNANYPFDGVAIVYDYGVTYRFQETSGQIEVFNSSTGMLQLLPTQRLEEFGLPYIEIQGGTKLKHGVCSTCNVKRWINNLGDFSAYVLYHW